MISSDLVAPLARREVLAAAFAARRDGASPSAMDEAALGMREAQPLVDFANGWRALGAEERAALADALVAWADPEHPRVWPAHETWFPRLERSLAAPDRARVRAWLRDGGPLPAEAGDDAWTQRLQHHAVRALCIGPTHLLACRGAAADHVGWVCLLDDDGLSAFLDDLGQRVIGITIATNEPRQMVAAIASLDTVHQPGVREAANAYRDLPSRVRARIQELLLDVTRALGAPGRAKLVPTLGLHLLAMASAGRFDLEVRCLMERLPSALSVRAERALQLGARRDLDLAHAARDFARSSLAIPACVAALARQREPGSREA